MDRIPPAFSVHGILQATRILKWVAIPFSRRSSQPRDRTWVSHIAGRFFTIWVTREAISFISWLIQIIVQWTWGCRFFFEVVILFPLDKYPEVGLLDHMVSSIFNLLRNLRTVFFFFFLRVRDFIFLGSKITADGNCSHEIKRCLLLGGRAMTNPDSILKSRDITWPINVGLVKAMAFPVVRYVCESWTIKKAEHWRTDAFELWCWRRLLRVPWTARRSNVSILKEISPEYSLEAWGECIISSVLSHHSKNLKQQTDQCYNSVLFGKPKKIHPQGVRVGGPRRHEEKRGPRLNFGSCFCMFFLLPLSLPCVNWTIQECCLFYLRFSVWPSDLPLFYFCDGLFPFCLLASTILDSFFLV